MTVFMSSSTKIDRSDSNIGEWLNSLGLGQYRQAFAENDIDFETLPTITGEDLRELGVVSLGHRKKLLAAIADLSSGRQKAQTLPQEAPFELPEGEYRQVTVLFADLSGFTRLSTELDAEATHKLLNRYFEVVDRIVENYRGRVDKHIGDNVMAVFGAPVAHSDDPQRAVRTALEIHRAMGSTGDEAGRPLQAHIGIASGQVVASNTGSDAHREYTVTGIAVNLASRLQDMAGPGETYVSDAVQRAIAEIATSEAKGAVEIKGLDQPVQVWRVQKLLEETLRSGRRPFVGRRSELAQFGGVLSACCETGSGQTVFVRGEAGIGKTRLVEEFQRLAEQQGFACYKSFVLDFGVGKGQDAICTLVRSLLGDCRRQRPGRARSGRRSRCRQRLVEPEPQGLPQRSCGSVSFGGTKGGL
jgi:class 3 adenylate cyclase